MSSKKIIFDTGSSLNYVPSKEFVQILTAIQKFRMCTKESDDLYYCPCDKLDNRLELYPKLSIHIGEASLQHWFYLEARDYFIYDRYYRKCLLTIMEEPNGSSFNDMWLMGDPFLRKYYSIYDMDAKRIGLVGVAASTRLDFEDSFDQEEKI
jgi:hypothetical protein